MRATTLAKRRMSGTCIRRGKKQRILSSSLNYFLLIDAGTSSLLETVSENNMRVSWGEAEDEHRLRVFVATHRIETRIAKIDNSYQNIN